MPYYHLDYHPSVRHQTFHSVITGVEMGGRSNAAHSYLVRLYRRVGVAHASAISGISLSQDHIELCVCVPRLPARLTRYSISARPARIMLSILLSCPCQ